MCGRYYLDTLPESLMEHFSISGVPSLEASYNIAPTQLAPVVRQGPDGPELMHARWGLIPFWARDTKVGNRMINARSETVSEKPAFRAAWERRRCVVPASGFYEWQRLESGKRPHAIAPASDPLFGFGGLWEIWKSSEGEAVFSFTILTTQANSLMQPIHDRMPVILAPADYPRWLSAADPRELQDCLRPSADDQLRTWPVSTRVNSPANNDRSLLESVA